ncbi:hypothetical protein LTR66_013815 [Elasticomyces elasticus]|nr:hypothetical protein LTR66_013815 [Elasticomyces elasticus]
MDALSLAKIRNLSPFDSSDPTADQPEEHLQEVPPAPIDNTPKPKTNLDLINDCDSFPQYTSDPSLYLKHVNTYYLLRVAAHPDTTLGYILPSVAEVFRGLPHWELDDADRILTLTVEGGQEARSTAVAATTAAMRATNHFAVLKGWRNELYPVYGPGGKQDLLFSIERAASPLFGVVTYGVHMTAFTRAKKTQDVGGGEEELRIWVGRRARNKQTYGGMLDNTVAGGIATGEIPFESLVREAAEEASLPEALVREKGRACGVVTYFSIRGEQAGGETGLLQPECQYVYDLELDGNTVPKPSDDEVEGFHLWSVNEVKEAMRRGEFKPNCALVLLDFFVRHGILTEENEKDYVEIVSRLHRRFEFPTR